MLLHTVETISSAVLYLEKGADLQYGDKTATDPPANSNPGSQNTWFRYPPGGKGILIFSGHFPLVHIPVA
jgi:hypothetical protein